MVTTLNKPYPSPLKVDLACGDRKKQGYLGVDSSVNSQADIIHDLNSYPYPFEDNSVDELSCEHFIEHVDDIIAFMEEIYRILKPEAKALIVAPYYANMRAWQDPTHKRAISEASFLYYNKDWRKNAKLSDSKPYCDMKCDFDFTYGYNIDTAWANRSQEARDFAIRHYINVVNDIQVVLTKRVP
jgi:predicted SAM-dependent methyltransferase